MVRRQLPCLTPTAAVSRQAHPLWRQRFMRSDAGSGRQKTPPPTPALITRRACIRQAQLAGVETFGQLEQRAAGTAPWVDDQGSLLGDGSLRGGVIERNHR